MALDPNAPVPEVALPMVGVDADGVVPNELCPKAGAPPPQGDWFAPKGEGLPKADAAVAGAPNADVVADAVPNAEVGFAVPPNGDTVVEAAPPKGDVGPAVLPRAVVETAPSITAKPGYAAPVRTESLYMIHHADSMPS